MRLKIELSCNEKNILLPVGYTSFIQAFIYNNLADKRTNWLYESGFSYEKRKFKLFSFSNILEKSNYIKENKSFIFPRDISFYLSSPVQWLVEEFSNVLPENKDVFLGRNNLKVKSVALVDPVVFDADKLKIRAITPIEVHSTFTKKDGKKITYYYTPFENGFSELVNNNLRKKWSAFHGEPCEDSINITPLYQGNKNEKIIYFGTGRDKILIKGWKGIFMLEGPNYLLNFAYYTGLGSKNSQGFGMWDIID